MLRVYIGGVEEQAVGLSGSIAASTSPLKIGANAVWGEYFSGLIDDVRIYNKALTPAQIAADMAVSV
jgi:hypothetical protein